MKKILAVSIVLASQSVFAGTYQAEVGASYATGEADSGSTTDDIDTWLAGGDFYFSKVSTDKGPLAEAAFLSKASSATAVVGRTSFDADAGDADSDYMNLGLQIVGPNDLVLAFDYTGNDSDDLDSDAESISLGVGTYLDDRHMVLFSYGVEVEDIDNGIETNTERFGADYHGFLPLGGDASLSYDAGLAYYDADYDSGNDDDGIGINAGITWYPMHQLGIGLALEQVDVGDVTTTSYAVDAQYFFTENVSVTLAYSASELDDDNAVDTVDTDLVAVAASVRF